MRFDPEKLKLTFEYVVENCKPGDTVPSTSYKGMSEDEMFEYARMSYSEGLLQLFIDCSSLNNVGCLIGNPTNRGYDLYSHMCKPEYWAKIKDVMKAGSVIGLTKVIEVLMG